MSNGSTKHVLPPGIHQQMYPQAHTILIQPNGNEVLGKGSGATNLPTTTGEKGNTHPHMMNFATFLRHNYLSFGLFIGVVLLIMMGLFWLAILHVGTHDRESPLPSTIPSSHSVDQLFRHPPPSPPSPPVPISSLQQQQNRQKTFDMIFRLMDGTPFEDNNTSIRVYDLGTDVSDMDMISIAFFTCCCNDKTIVICDNRQPPQSAIHKSPGSTAVQLTDYSVSCYLSHDPNVPAINTENNKYKHRWKLIVQFGPAFDSVNTATDCAFSTSYYTTMRPLPPPPNPPANNINKKIW